MTDEAPHDTPPPHLIAPAPAEPLGLGVPYLPRPGWIAPEEPDWPSKVNRSVDVNTNVDTTEPAALPGPYTVPTHRVAQVESWLRANKARALDVFRHGDNTEEVVRTRIAELFGPVSESGMLTAPSGIVGTAIGAATGTAAGAGVVGVVLGAGAGVAGGVLGAAGTTMGLLGEVGRGKGALIKRMPTTQHRLPGADRRLP